MAMVREVREVAFCDHPECDRKCQPEALEPTGWLLGVVRNRNATVDLCPEHREDLQEWLQEQADTGGGAAD